MAGTKPSNSGSAILRHSCVATSIRDPGNGCHELHWKAETSSDISLWRGVGRGRREIDLNSSEVVVSGVDSPSVSSSPRAGEVPEKEVQELTPMAQLCLRPGWHKADANMAPYRERAWTLHFCGPPFVIVEIRGGLLGFSNKDAMF